MKWNSEQLRAIELRDKNILVSAAAGSGKTTVLTARISKLLQEGEDIDRFLIITFTKASAKDMRQKIRQKLIEDTKTDPSLKDQLRKLPEANIQTIDSFCHSVVRENFHVLDIDPSFRVAPETEVSILEAAVIDELFEEHYDKGERDFLDLIEIFGDDRSDSEVKKQILSLEGFLSNHLERQALIQKILTRYDDKEGWRRRYDRFLQEKKQEILSLVDEALDLEPHEGLRKLLEDEYRSLENLPAKVTYARLIPVPKALKGGPDDDIQAEVKALRESWKKAAKNLSDLYQDGFEAEYERYFGQKERIRTLLSLTEEFHDRFFELRKEQNMFTFADIEELCYKALLEPAVAAMYQNRFRHIYIDEYQDTNPIQEGIISKIKSPSNRLFMVGDIKQSIYGFRQADPTIFLEKYDAYATASDENERIDLNSNYRSGEKVLAGINRIFEKLFRKDFGGIDYDDKTRLVFGNQMIGEGSEPALLLTYPGQNDKFEAEMNSIAEAIKAYHARGIAYKDIVVLLRSPGAYKEAVAKVSLNESIPIYMDYSTAYLQSLEIELLLSYLKLIDNTRQDVDLLALLRLPRYAVTDDELYSLRHNKRSGTLYELLKKQDHQEPLSAKLGRFFSEIEALRRSARMKGIDALLQEIYYAYGFENFVLTLSQPEQRLANVRQLFALASEYEATSFTGLSKFLKYIESLLKKDQDFEAAKTQSEDADVVRLMSIHKSKGLEAEAVIVGGLHRSYNELDSRAKLVSFKQDVIMDHYDLSRRVKRKSVFRALVTEGIQRKNREEEVRLLYVAMTRAKLRLTLSFVVNEKSAGSEKAPKPHTLQSLRNANSYLKLVEGCEVLGDFLPLYEALSRDEVQNKQAFLEEVKQSREKVQKVTPREVRPATVQGKVSVSSLVKDKQIAPLTDLMSPVVSFGAEGGIAFHKAMQWIDFKDPENSLRVLSERGILKDFKDELLLQKFLSDPLLKELLETSLEIRREVPFVVKSLVKGEETLIQGIIDLVLVKEDGVIIIDYKTDRTKAYLESYKEQVREYARAWEAIKETQVLEKYIWFVRLGSLEEVE